jgi:ferredoxin-NADP reductase
MAESIHEKMMRMHGAGGKRPGHSMGNMEEMKKASFEVALKDKKQIAESTMSFTFEKPQTLKFRAGQHVRMTLIDPPETDDEGDSRFLSIASTPQNNDLIFAVRMRDTAFKRALKNIQPGTKVLIQVLLGVPHGAFALHEDATKPGVFIVGGIGIVPVYSMIKDAGERRLPHKLYLFYSNRRPEDAPFLAELQVLAKQNPNFTLIATMTEAEKSVQAWQGETKRIDSSMLKRHVSNFASPVYYLAGLPEMVSAMKTMLADLSVQADNIHAEEFTGFNLNDLPGDTGDSSKSRLALILIGLLVLPVIMVHGVAALSLTKSDSNMFSFSNPLTYVLFGLMLVALVFKFKHVSSFLQKRKNK